jgi:two-component system, sporulation sensor kinase D
VTFLKRTDYTKPFFILFFAISILFASMVLYFSYTQIDTYNQNILNSEIDLDSKYEKSRISHILDHSELTLEKLQYNHILTEFISKKEVLGIEESKNHTKILFETVVQNNPRIMQLRYLDINGKEVIRVDRTKYTNIVEDKKDYVKVIPDNKLQDKSNRYYFQDSIKLQKNQTFVSKLDLNVERGKIERPLKPVIRVAKPIFLNNEKKGILIINIFMEQYFKDLLKSDLFNIALIDQDNHVLVNNFKDINNWSRYLKSNKIDLNSISKYKKIELIKTKGGETFYLVYQIKDSAKSIWNIFTKIQMIFFVFGVIISSFIIAYLLSRIPKRLFDELEEHQKVIIQQSKFAAKGEMTHMLAHQWRQPLNAIGILMQELKFLRKKDKLTDQNFDTIYSQTKDTLDAMSDTIESFRSFFKNDNKYLEFNIIDTIKHTENVFRTNFDAENIALNYHYDENSYNKFSIFGSQNEFEQVVANMFSNSYEVLKELSSDNTRELNISLNIDEHIMIKFCDNGKGIKDDVIDKIFDPYFSTKLDKNGTGLGLYMSKIIIEQKLKGKIKAYNHQDGGACFEIRLPIE